MDQEKINRLAAGSISALGSLDAMEVIELAKAHLELQELKKQAERGNCCVDGLGGRKWVFVPELDLLELIHFRGAFDRIYFGDNVKNTWQFVQAVREEWERMMKTAQTEN